MRCFTISLLHLSIGIGFTFSLVFGAALTMLMLFHGSGDNLALNRPIPDWGWGGGAAIAWASTLFWWSCWRCLPAVKPKPLFPSLERSLQKPASPAGIIISTIGVLSGFYLMLGEGLKLLVHTAGASWPHFLWWALIAVSNGFWAFSSWKQWRRKRQAKTFTGGFYGKD